MTKAEELTGFLAWVQDNYLAFGDGRFMPLSAKESSASVTREVVVAKYLEKTS